MNQNSSKNSWQLSRRGLWRWAGSLLAGFWATFRLKPDTGSPSPSETSAGENYPPGYGIIPRREITLEEAKMMYPYEVWMRICPDHGPDCQLRFKMALHRDERIDEVHTRRMYDHREFPYTKIRLEIDDAPGEFTKSHFYYRTIGSTDSV